MKKKSYEFKSETKKNKKINKIGDTESEREKVV